METNSDFLIPFLTFIAVMAVGAAVLAARAARRRPVKARLRQLTEDSGDEPALDRDEGALGGLGGLAGVTSFFAPSKPSESLKAQLARAGYHSPSASTVYLGSKMLLLIAGTLATVAAILAFELPFAVQLLIGISCGALLSFLPNFVVRVRREKRRTEIRSHLPDAVDLLEICVAAGMGLDMAWNSVADEIRGVSPTLADEMALANLEIHLGASRTEAMRNMVVRTGADELGSLVAVLVQSERFGTSIAEALRTFAASMRTSRSQKAEESAEKMAVKLLFPMVLFIFPVVLIVVAGPAGIVLVDIMGGK